MNLLTIITLTKNNNNELLSTLKSIIRFKYICMNSELLIIDGSDEIIHEKNKELICQFENHINLNIIDDESYGIYAAMNQGIKMASSKFLIFLNSGDQFSKELDEYKLINFISKNLNSNSINLFFCRTRIISTLNKKIKYFNPSKNINLTKRKILPYIEPPSHQACFFRTSWHKKNLYKLDIGYRADREIILKSFKNSQFIDTVSSIFYLSGLSSLNNQSLKKIIDSSILTKSKRLIIANTLKILFKLFLKNNWEYLRLFKHYFLTLIP